jgi:hypothetical protein
MAVGEIAYGLPGLQLMAKRRIHRYQGGLAFPCPCRELDLLN